MFQAIGNAVVKKSRPSQAATQRRSVHLKLDVTLLLVTVTLVLLGILMVYSASWDYSLTVLKESANFMISRQIGALGFAIIVAVVLTFFDYRIFRRLAVFFLVLTIAGLIAVLVISDERNNAVRTLIAGSGQPSELAKIVTIIYLAVWLYAKKDQLSDVGFGLLPLGGILGLVGGLIILQPDLSAVVTIFIIGGMMFFLAGGDLKQIGVLIVLAVFFGSLVVLLNPTGNNRIASYLAGIKNPFEASYHVQRSLEAFANGGWIGEGIGNSKTKLTGLPVPPTDSIFAVIGEEMGVLGAGLVALLYGIFMWRGLQIARRAPDGLGTLLAAGLSLWLPMEAFINMAGLVNLLPFAGTALPFISYGGSNLTVSLAAVGILLNISRLSVQSQEENGKFFGAVVDLRRRDRRRRVSRTRRA